MTFLAEHKLLFQLLTILLIVGLALSVVWVALPGRSRGRHRSRLTAADRGHIARHAARTIPAHLPRHAAADGGLAVALGHAPGGDLALMDDTHELAVAA